MLEVLAFLTLGPWVGRVAQGKGHDGGLFTGLFVGAWLAGEGGGLVSGMVLTGRHGGLLVPYLLGLLGAAVGAYLVYAVAVSLSDPWHAGAGKRRRRPRRPAAAARVREADRPRQSRAIGEGYALQDDAPAPRRKKARLHSARC